MRQNALLFFSWKPLGRGNSEARVVGSADVSVRRRDVSNIRLALNQ